MGAMRVVADLANVGVIVDLAKAFAYPTARNPAKQASAIERVAAVADTRGTSQNSFDLDAHFFELVCTNWSAMRVVADLTNVGVGVDVSGVFAFRTVHSLGK